MRLPKATTNHAKFNSFGVVDKNHFIIARNITPRITSPVETCHTGSVREVGGRNVSLTGATWCHSRVEQPNRTRLRHLLYRSSPGLRRSSSSCWPRFSGQNVAENPQKSTNLSDRRQLVQPLRTIQDPGVGLKRFCTIPIDSDPGRNRIGKASSFSCSCLYIIYSLVFRLTWV